MSFAHIENLYRSQDILLFKECYALEKVHGMSAWITLHREKGLTFYAGGASEVNFRALFDADKVKAHLESLGCEEATVFGEVHGGDIMHASNTYGKQMAFVAFDLQIDRLFLSVPQMDELLTKFGFEVIPYKKIPTTMEAIDAERDAPSIVAVRRGITEPKPREGVVLRPLMELTKNNGERIIAKHKIEKHSERRTPQKVEDPAKLKVLADAKAIAEEWVTPNRFEHVVSKLRAMGTIIGCEMRHAPIIIAAMQEDVTREAKGEIIVSKEAMNAIGKKTVELLRKHVDDEINKLTEPYKTVIDDATLKKQLD